MKGMSKGEEDFQYIRKQIDKLVDGMVDLSWELDRMSSSGEETYEEMRFDLLILSRLINEQKEEIQNGLGNYGTELQGEEE